MNKRLEMLERARELKSSVVGNYEHSTDIQDEELVEWLIEQAEQVQIAKEDVRVIELKIDEAYSERNRLREALKFYADEANYVSKEEYLMENLPSNIEFECGAKARQALERESK